MSPQITQETRLITDQSEEAIDFRRLGDDSTELIVALDAEFRFIYVNPSAERLLDTPRETLLGRSIFDIAPDARDSDHTKPLRRAMQDRIVVEFEACFPAWDRWIHVRCVPESHGGLIIFAHDVSAQHHAERVHHEAVQALLSSESQARRGARMLDSVSEAYVTLDRDFRITFVNAEAARISRKAVESMVGNLHWEEWPASVGTEFERQLRRAMAERVPVRFLERYYIPGVYDQWMDMAAYPAADEDGGGLHLVCQDVTERIKREQRDQFLAGLAERARTLTDPEAVIADTVRSVGIFLGVERCTFANIDLAADTCTIHPDYCANDSVKSIAGVLPIAAFGPFLIAEFKAGRAIVVNDVLSDTERVPGENIDAYEAIDIRAHVTVPVVHSHQLVSTIAVHCSNPRNWTPEEVDLLRAVVERTWLTVEVTRQQSILKREAAERERLLAETSARAEREALLNRIGAAVRSTLEPDAIIQAAVTALGRGLQADRCYFVVYNLARDSGTITIEWFREDAGLGPISGVTRQMSGYSVNREAAFKSANRQVVPDTIAFNPQGAASLLALNVRALVRVPFEVGDRMSAFGVAMSFGTRDWTEDEVALVENVAILVRSALESAHIQQRERNIARQLQAALLPELPKSVPGMVLRGFYRAALEEAGVGGDFTDVFSARDGALTCLVVSDLSGKGLAAASQVAAVKNMLRFALYSDGSVAAAVTRLNQVLAGQGLLSGFATLFVGMYDAAARTLTYVNCGQEPSLIWRSNTATVEQLPPTGPVLGGFQGGAFTESSVAMSPGDVLAVFTDGMTEVGPNRRALLTIDGLIELFAQTCIASGAVPAAVSGAVPDIAESIVKGLIAGVEAYARGADRIRDDIALLVGVAIGDPAAKKEIAPNGKD